MNRNITAVILIVLAIGVYLTYTSKEWVKLRAIQKVNADYSQAIENAEELIATRDRILAQYNALSPVDRDRLSKMIPSTLDSVRLIIDLNNIAQRRGLVLKDIDAGGSSSVDPAAAAAAAAVDASAEGALAPSAGPILNTTSISFSVTTTYQQFLDFLKDIESSLRILDVSNLRLQTTENGLYLISVKLNAYWLSQ